MRLHPRRFLLPVLMAFAMMCLTSSRLFSGLDDEEYAYTVKAVFIYNFTRYLQWPEEKPEDPFTIGVLGDSPIVEPLREIAEKKTVRDRPIEVLRYEDAGEISNVEMLFIPGEMTHLWPSVREQLKGEPVITVGEREGLAEQEVAINFVPFGETIKFEINEQAIREKNIFPGSQLLHLALRIVE